MIERPQGGEQAILVHIHFPVGGMQEDLDEFKELAVSAGAQVLDIVQGVRAAPDPKYFVGAGKAEEIRAAVLVHQAQLVLFNHALSPAQERNLERLIGCRVLDRTGLILDIFAQRARSFEGKLQVELALLKHQSTRLVRGWTHLERQRGGIGLRGPGETQLETDRRLIRARIRVITQRLTKVRQQREQNRHARRKAAVPTLALVGYTNAGKSTLFNWLSGAEVYAANQLFATLDPTLRRFQIPEIGFVILADTVGFIRHLPHDLVDAFRATLEEVCEADLLLHVVDAHDERLLANIAQVNQVLTSIGADTVPCLMVYNKIDLCARAEPRFDQLPEGQKHRVWVSASQKLGFDELAAAIKISLAKDIIQAEIILKLADGKVRSNLYAAGAVISETIQENGYHLLVRLPREEYKALLFLHDNL